MIFYYLYDMIEKKHLLAVGSPSFSRQLAAILKRSGWQVESFANEQDAVKFSQEMHIAPQYLVTDTLEDWVIRLSRELQSQGTQIILSGFMRETPEELERILGVTYYSIMGLPSKVADVLLGWQNED